MIPFDSPKFKDPSVFQSEAMRIYDVCHGCRRCFNLCPSFDVLFRGIDEKDGELGAVEPAVLDRVVDLCYYCKLCFNHCPYCPPHAYDLDFPRLMLWGKHVKSLRVKPRLRDRLLADVDLMGRLLGWAAPITNRMMRLRVFRILLEKIMGLHRDRRFPSFHRRSFSSWFGRNRTSRTSARAEAAAARPEEGQSRGAAVEKVALFYTCYVNRHDPGIGKAAVQVLQKNGVEVSCPEQQCCGMPYFDIGDLDTARQKARANLKTLSAEVDAGRMIVAPMPTCSLMLKKEYLELVPGEESRKVAAHTLDLCEYLMKLDGRGKLSRDFVSTPGRVAYQIPCHLRDQNIGLKSRDLMRLIPGTTVEVIERCSGHDGAFGVKQEYYDLSQGVGRKAFRAAVDAEPDIVASDCPLSGLAIEQKTGLKSVHPIQIVQKAYGLG